MQEISLSGTWEVAHALDGQGGPQRLEWRPGPVPGVVQQVLRTFPDPGHDGRVELHFAGLDTFEGGGVGGVDSHGHGLGRSG